MIEMIMYFGGGFLVASLLAIVLISFVHQRAVRLTQRRLADAIPVSMAEIQADKDHLRAEFALSARRLEMSVEQLKAKATAQLSDIARKTEAINLLKAELVEKTAVTDELSGKAKILGGKLTQAEQENLEKATALEATAQTVAAKDAEIANAANIIATLNHAADTQRVEVAVLNTQIEDLKSQIGDIQQATESTAQRLLSEQSTTAGVHKDLYQARQTIEMLHPQVARLEHELAAHANELENRASLIGELDARIAEQNRLLRQREAEAQDLHQELASTREDAAAAAERLRSARAAVETQLQTANDMLSERAGRIEDHERRISDFDRLVRQRDAEAHALSQEIATRKDEASAARTKWAGEKLAYEAHLATNDQALAERAVRIADFERRVADFERLLAQRDADAKSLHQEIAVLREEAATAAVAWLSQKTSLDGQLSVAHDTLAERGGRIAAFERQVAEFERLVSQRDAEARALHQQIATLKAEAAAATAQWHDEKTNFHAQFATASDTLTERAGVIAAFERQVAEFERLVSRRDAEAQALHQAIATHKDEAAAATAQWHDEKTNFHAQFATASDTLTERAGVIAAFEQQVAEFERLVSRRDAEAQALHHEITTLKDEAAVTAELWLADKASLDAQLVGLTGTSTERAFRIEGFEQQVADLEQLSARREAEAKALHQEIVSLEEQAAAGEARWFAEKTSFEERVGSANDTLAARAQRIEELEGHVQEFKRLVSQREAEAQTLHREIATLKEEANTAAERWIGGTTNLEAQLASAGAHLESRASRIGDLESWIAERQRLLQQREAELAGLTSEIASLHEQSAATEGRLLDANAALTSELQTASNNFARAQAELAALNREAEATWRAERSENTLLRERISDIAAQIAHMTMTLERSGSPIAAILADSANGIGGAEVTAPRPGNLTDRIRALQSGASRISTAS
jgi:chromosome segregation ATPase